MQEKETKNRTKTAILKIQSWFRGCLARKKYAKMQVLSRINVINLQWKRIEMREMKRKIPVIWRNWRKYKERKEEKKKEKVAKIFVGFVKGVVRSPNRVNTIKSDQLTLTPPDIRKMKSDSITYRVSPRSSLGGKTPPVRQRSNTGQ